MYGNKTRGVKKGRQSGGISAYYKQKLKDQISVIEKNDIGIIWLKIKNDIFRFDDDVFICFAYIPPVSSKNLQDQDFDFFEEIEKGLEKYNKMGKTYVVGDLNSRRAEQSDILDFDKYLDNIENDESDDEILNDYLNMVCIRNNQDKTIDNNGKKLLALCRSTDHIIANGRLYSDQNGELTFCSQRGLSVTDYLLLHIFDINTLTNFEVLKWNNFSDHAALMFSFSMSNSKSANKTKSEKITYEEKIIYEELKNLEFMNTLNHNLQDFDTLFDSEKDISTQIKNLTYFLTENSRTVFGQKFPVYTNKNKTSKNTPKWFNEECFTTKQEFKRARNIFTKDKNDENRIRFTKLRPKYNRARQKAKARYKLNESKRLENIAKTQPRKFWKSIKKCYNKTKGPKDSINIDDLYEHFNELLGQNVDDNENGNMDFTNISDDDLDCKISEQCMFSF